MTEVERKYHDPWTDTQCGYLTCEKQAVYRCEVCGWAYCGQHWEAKMHAVHIRMHKREREKGKAKQ